MGGAASPVSCCCAWPSASARPWGPRLGQRPCALCGARPFPNSNTRAHVTKPGTPWPFHTSSWAAVLSCILSGSWLLSLPSDCRALPAGAMETLGGPCRDRIQLLSSPAPGASHRCPPPLLTFWPPRVSAPRGHRCRAGDLSAEPHAHVPPQPQAVSRAVCLRAACAVCLDAFGLTCCVSCASGARPSTVPFPGSLYCSLVAAVQPDLAAWGLSPWLERPSGQGPWRQHPAWHRTRQRLRHYQTPAHCPLGSAPLPDASVPRGTSLWLTRFRASPVFCHWLPLLSSDPRISVSGTRPGRPSPLWVSYHQVRGSGSSLTPRTILLGPSRFRPCSPAQLSAPGRKP